MAGSGSPSGASSSPWRSWRTCSTAGSARTRGWSTHRSSDSLSPNLTLDYLEEEGALLFADLEGEILVVNFWASWCIPCRYEHPALTAASEAYAGRGVRFVGIVYQDSKERAVGFLDEFGRGANYSYVVDADSRVTVELGVFGIPETYFVDAQGVIRGKVQGAVDAVVLVSTIEDMLAGRDIDG